MTSTPELTNEQRAEEIINNWYADAMKHGLQFGVVSPSGDFNPLRKAFIEALSAAEARGAQREREMVMSRIRFELNELLEDLGRQRAVPGEEGA